MDNFKALCKSPEMKRVASRMKLISTPRELSNGTLVFDTGIKQKCWDSCQPKADIIAYCNKTTSLYKIYATGQIRGETIQPGERRDHYKIGAPITGATEIDMYKNALIEIAKKYDRRVKNA
jgi:hypothetical protein